MKISTIRVENSQLFPIILDAISRGHTASITARGYSMRPFIEHDRDILIFGALQTVKVGDVVLAELSPGQYVCHRVWKIQGDSVTLRGDGNWPGTETCRCDDLRASLVAIERKGRTYTLATSRVWRIYSAAWTFLLPLRRYLLAIHRRIIKLNNIILHRTK